MLATILSLPLLSFMTCHLGGRWVGDRGAKYVAVICLAGSFFCALLLFYCVYLQLELHQLEGGVWFNVGLLSTSYGLQADALVAGMLVLVTGVSTLVHLYSTAYMEGDPHLRRFLSYLSLFTCFMIVLVTASNLVQLFIGWEGVGLCSYLLINFWYTRVQANKAAIKAMVVNKVGDIGVLLAMAFLWGLCGTLDYQGITALLSLGVIDPLALQWCGFLLLIGVIGKSAQLGLHMWLPDAMEGPTPVSALIHAATMVTAGVFLIIRMSPLFEQTPTLLLAIVLVGSLTAFFSATIGLGQHDLKKVIAYSTCSQLGYMVMICGFSHYNCGLFHLINHGFFKALLFLSAGSVIHAVANEQDMRRMGGLRFTLPLSFACIMIGSLSLMGLPFLTGFYSKDLLLELAYGAQALSFALWLGLAAAAGTAFYSFRLAYYTFGEVNHSSSFQARTAHEGSWALTFPLVVLAILSVVGGYLLEPYILGEVSPVMLPDANKWMPLLFSGAAAGIALLWGWTLASHWQSTTTRTTMVLQSLACGAWYFDVAVTTLFVLPTLRLGFGTTYKLLDNQLLEGLGPTRVTSLLSQGAANTSRVHRGQLPLYSFLFVLFVGCFLLFN